MKRKIICLDKYEAEKLASLIYIKEGKETYITEILNIIDNEIVVMLKDKSAHSVLLKDGSEVESFADFIQSIFEKEHKIVNAITTGNEVEITKE
jgi:predicted SnoaL-like aldol condensation-catalyzing enzyme